MPGIEAAHRVFNRETDSIWWGGPVLQITIPTYEGVPGDDVMFGAFYEAAHPSWVWYQAGVETNLDQWRLSTVSSVAMPMPPIPIFGSLGIGGVFQAGGGGFEAGFRMHATFFLGGVLGIGNYIDIHPGTERRVRHSLFARLSI